MSQPITITVSDEALRAALRRLVTLLSDTTPTMRALSEIMLDASERAFAGRADPVTGKAWPALSPARLRQRAKKGRSPANILQDEGRLIGSLQGLAGGADAVRRIGPGYALVGTNVPYAAAHQFGATIKRKAGTVKLAFGRKKGHWGFVQNTKRARYGMKAGHGPYEITIPARPFLGVGDEDIQDMLETVARHLSRTFAGNGV